MPRPVKLPNWFRRFFSRSPEPTARTFQRGQAVHVVILDGTLSTLQEGCETNVGQIYKLLRELGPSANQTVYYEAGIQWEDWGSLWDVITGKGINRKIRRAYGALASRYRPGDKIVLIGYSRGAYGVRSLAGVIDRVGLVRSEHATERNILTAYRHYQAGGSSEAAVAFRASRCHEHSPIEAVAVFDTVKALGIRLPVFWRLTESLHSFHDHSLGDTTRNGFHALAKDERRTAYAPVMWECHPDFRGHMEQVWFRGNHGDIGGQIVGAFQARPLSNIPLVWMLERLQACGLLLPEDALTRFHQDAYAPSSGPWHGWAKFFFLRKMRVVGACRSERVHHSVALAQAQDTTKAQAS